MGTFGFTLSLEIKGRTLGKADQEALYSLEMVERLDGHLSSVWTCRLQQEQCNPCAPKLRIRLVHKVVRIDHGEVFHEAYATMRRTITGSCMLMPCDRTGCARGL